MKVIITSKPNFEGMSVEAGRHDGVNHFDHHGPFSGEVPVCQASIPKRPDATIEITHTDADTILALSKIGGKDLSVLNLNLDLIAEVDCNGSSIVKDKFDRSLLFVVGVGAVSRQLGIPRPTPEGIDITEKVISILSMNVDDIIEEGRKAQTLSEKAYKDCCIAVNGPVGFWSIGPLDQLDPSRPYEDDITTVVVYRSHYKSISIYCDPKSEESFAGEEVAGIKFAGHPKACGSPRGVEFTEEDARRVYLELCPPF